MTTENKTAEIVNDLIEINNDRIEGYTRALEDLKDEENLDLRSLFEDYIQQTRQFNSELNPLVVINGEEPTTGTRTSGKLHRLWLDVKATFSGHDRKSILEECERGEDASKKAYHEALREAPHLPINVVDVIRSQAEKQLQAHDRIRDLRDSSI
ncbi:ferritin-like domain-containing protein [Sphingobacterium spiritivorum]|uniref:ferritin-like domain-containing protein n=1 Tax=Sphingobacterium spiritivorum TaxID=258 RepID=UPI003DA4FAE8